MKERYVIKEYRVFEHIEYFWCRRDNAWKDIISYTSGFMSEADARSQLINFKHGIYEIIKIYIK